MEKNSNLNKRRGPHFEFAKPFANSSPSRASCYKIQNLYI